VVREHVHTRDFRLKLTDRLTHSCPGERIRDLEKRLCGRSLGAEGYEVGGPVSRRTGRTGEYPRVVPGGTQALA
jgi:hypothetical protein